MNNNNNSSSNNNLLNNSQNCKNSTEQEQPDPDNIKMFVGQVPRSMDENDLRKMFEEYGRVHSINVLRDKGTGASKGESEYYLLFVLYDTYSKETFFESLKTLNVVISVLSAYLACVVCYNVN